MKIIIELEKPVQGFWDNGAKSHFEFTPEHQFSFNKYGNTIKWGSWEANYWFIATKGKTDKLSLKYAIQSLKSALKKQKIKSITTEL